MLLSALLFALIITESFATMISIGDSSGALLLQITFRNETRYIRTNSGVKLPEIKLAIVESTGYKPSRQLWLYLKANEKPKRIWFDTLPLSYYGFQSDPGLHYVRLRVMELTEEGVKKFEIAQRELRNTGGTNIVLGGKPLNDGEKEWILSLRSCLSQTSNITATKRRNPSAVYWSC